MPGLLEATKENFAEVTASGRVIVDVWGPQCAPCIALMPHVEKLAADRDDVTVVKLEAPKARRLCMELRVMGLPTFLMFEDGQEVSRITDPDLDADQLEQWIDSVVGDRKEEIDHERA